MAATAASASQINLAWTASTDNVGVSGYRVERCQGVSCTNFAQISTPTANSYSNTGLAANTAYRYRVRAADAAGNLSSYSSIASATTQSGGSGAATGLDFPGSAAVSSTMRFKFADPHLNGLPAYGPNNNGVTYIWRAYPRQQPGYYTAFFWGNDDGGGTLCTFLSGGDCYYAETYYGAHPYPRGSSTSTTHDWEISIEQSDYVNGQVVYDRWYIQALRVWSDASGKHREFYWDLPNTDAAHRVTRTSPSTWGNDIPPAPALTWGDAPWAPGNEVWNGILRGIQIYASNLSVTDIISEANSPLSTTAGAGNVWYLNVNPTPTDISDKSGRGHHPAWVGSQRPALYTSGGGDTTAPTVTITAPANGATVSGTITVSGTASDNVGVTGVQFRVDGANTGAEDTTAPYTYSLNTTSLSNGAHTLTAVARDATGNTATSAGISVTVNNPTLDTQAPSIPANLAAVAVSSTQINLTWTASTDNFGVTGYRIFRGGSQIATSVGTAYQNTGLTASTLYSYTVAAQDGSGNVSGQSGTASATTLDPLTPPINQAPVPNAGTNQAITLPNNANLSGTASDDGLPNPPASLTYAWSKVSGPGTVTFSAGTSLNTSARFLQAEPMSCA